MNSGKILIVDDDESFLRMYEDRLGEEGYVVDTVKDRAGALQKMDLPGWDVILIDQKLQGEGGPDAGLELVAEAARRAPAAKAFLVTGYATKAAIARAFREGAYDYLQKDELFTALLAPKLRNAVQAVRAQRLAELSSAETEADIRATWEATEREKNPNRKGKLLEDLMVLLFKTIPGFRQTTPNRQNDIEEIDLLVQNESPDPFWLNDRSSYFLVECKNWSGTVGVAELQRFLYKLQHRFGRCRLGFFVAPGGFAGTFQDALLAERTHEYLIVPIDGEALGALVVASDRNAVLKRFHGQAVMALGSR
jgi:ActR/RegA family two-component response regulator